jgi:hypothetical protein
MTMHDQDDNRHGGDSYWRQWVQPPTVITLIVAAATVYGSQVIQAERLETMRAKVEAIERDYQRRDVLAEQLRSIDGRLYTIEQKLGDRSPLIR